MPDQPLQHSFDRCRSCLLADNRVGVVPLLWSAPVPDADSFLGELHRLGFEGIQMSDHLDISDPDLSSRLNQHDMRVAEVYAALPCSPSGPGADALDVGRDRLEMLKTLNGDVLVVAIDGSPDRDRITARVESPQGTALTESGWRELGEVTNQLASEAVAAGYRLAFHPHAGTFVETSAETDRLLAETDPSLVGLCIDTGHCIVGGGDPVTVINRYSDRISHVHLKDVVESELFSLRSGATETFTDAVVSRVFCPLGSGVLDLAGVVTALDRISYQGWLMIEQDSSWEAPAEASAISRRILDWVQRHPGEADVRN